MKEFKIKSVHVLPPLPGAQKPQAKASCCPPKTPPGAATENPDASACCPPSQATATVCCPPTEPTVSTDSCCSPPSPTGPEAEDRPGFRRWPFVTGWLQTPAGAVPQVAVRLTRGDVLGRWQMRWGLGRMRYRIAPGLYAVGCPDAESPVLVTANYKLTFDTLRRELPGIDAWILVLETFGINVWCAAGKGTFGTAEIIRRVRATRLDSVVRHRNLILPQLGAPGVAAHEVRRESGFKVVYGPVRAIDLPTFLAAGMQATPEMRRVTFTTSERLVLTPVELTGMLKPIGWTALGLLILAAFGPQLFHPAAAFARGLAAIGTGLAGVLAGAVLTPVLLPWLPGRAFALKGAVTGGGVALFGLLLGWSRLDFWSASALLLALPAVSSWCAMSFTGSTTFTSPSGVEKEMRRAIPLQGVAAMLAGVLWIYGGFVGK